MQVTPPSALSSELTISGCWRIRCLPEEPNAGTTQVQDLPPENPSIHKQQVQFHEAVVSMEPCRSRNWSGVVHVLPVCVR